MLDLLDIHDLQKIFKLGRTAAYRLTRTAGFPPAVMVSAGCYRWQPAEVQDYIATLPRTPAPSALPAAQPHIQGTHRPKRKRRVGGAR